jgi:uncharacterized membrane protein
MTSLAARIARNLRTNLLAGLLVMVPVGVTILIFGLLFRKVDAILGPLMYSLLAKWWPEIFNIDRRVPGLGIAATLLLLYIAGSLTRFYFGRQILGLWERFISKVPLFRTINKTAKQIMATFTSADAQPFRRVVFLRFPRDGIYTLCFVTGEIRTADGKLRTILFVPTPPNPANGLLFIAGPDEIVESNMSVEEAVRMIVSAGISHRSAGATPSVEPSAPQVRPSPSRDA